MTKKNLTILWVLALVLAGLAGLALTRTQKSWQGGSARVGELLLGDVPAEKVRQIRIAGPGASTELKSTDGLWSVSACSGYPADPAKVAELLTTVMTLKPAQILAGIEPGDLAHMKLQPPKATDTQEAKDAGTLLSLLDENGKEIGSLLLGLEHKSGGSAGMGGMGGWPDGRYVKLPNAGDVVLVTETFSQVSTAAKDWLDKSFLKVERIKRAACAQGGTNIWTLVRESDSSPLAVEGGVPQNLTLDNSKVGSLESGLRYPSFEELGEPARPAAEWGFAEGRTLAVDTFDGFHYEIKVGKKLESRYPVAIEAKYDPAADQSAKDKAPAADQDKDAAKAKDEREARVKAELARYKGWIYLVPAYTVDNWIPGREDLLKKKDETPSDKVTRPLDGAGKPIAPALSPLPIPPAAAPAAAKLQAKPAATDKKVEAEPAKDAPTLK